MHQYHTPGSAGPTVHQYLYTRTHTCAVAADPVAAAAVAVSMGAAAAAVAVGAAAVAERLIACRQPSPYASAPHQGSTASA